MCSYILIPATPELGSRSEFAVGAGASYNVVTVDALITGGAVQFHNSTTPEVRTYIWGVRLKGSYDYYLGRSVSLQGKVECNLVPSVNVPAVDYIESYSNTVTTLNSHSVDYSAIDLSIGVRLHF